jgi:hypothetical protein
MRHPHEYFNSGILQQGATWIKRLVGLPDRTVSLEREFELVVRIFDGLHGARLFEKHYQTTGLWDAAYGEKTGFASAAFWQTHYGQAVHTTLLQSAKDIADQIDCQPYMARLEVKPLTQAVLIHGGTNNGLTKGDSFPIFKLLMHDAAYPFHAGQLQLLDNDARITLEQVLPDHAFASSDFFEQPVGEYVVVAW